MPKLVTLRVYSFYCYSGIRSIEHTINIYKRQKHIVRNLQPSCTAFTVQNSFAIMGASER